MLALRQVDETHRSSQMVRQLTAGDKIIGSVQEYIIYGWLNQLPNKVHRLQPYFSILNELSLVKDLIYWGHRLVVSTAIRTSMLQLLNEPLQGTSS